MLMKLTPQKRTALTGRMWQLYVGGAATWKWQIIFD